MTVDDFREMLDDVEQPVVLWGTEYNFSYVIEQVDPIAFRVAMADYESMLEEDE